MSQKKFYQYILVSSLIFVPGVLFAQLKNIAATIVSLLNLSVSLIMGLSLVAFIIGLVRFIATAGDDKSRADGKQMMVWGTISLFVMVSVWGLVNIIKATLF